MKKPKCPECGKPLYKSLSMAHRAAKDYIFCHNSSCASYATGFAREGYWRIARKGERKGFRKPVLNNLDKMGAAETAPTHSPTDSVSNLIPGPPKPLPERDQSDGKRGAELAAKLAKQRAQYNTDYPYGQRRTLGGFWICDLCYELNGDCGQCVDTRRVQVPQPEHPSVEKARERIRSLINAATEGKPTTKTMIGLLLALVSQETGNQSAANALISEHKLDQLYGLNPQQEWKK